jgi:hypothetical protein
MRVVFRWLALTKPANDRRIENAIQVKPALRLQAERWQQALNETENNE